MLCPRMVRVCYARTHEHGPVRPSVLLSLLLTDLGSQFAQWLQLDSVSDRKCHLVCPVLRVLRWAGEERFCRLTGSVQQPLAATLEQSQGNLSRVLTPAAATACVLVMSAFCASRLLLPGSGNAAQARGANGPFCPRATAAMAASGQPSGGYPEPEGGLGSYGPVVEEEQQ